MTTNEKLNYIIRIFNDIVNKAQTIGELPDYTIGENDDSAYIGLYNSIGIDTEKISLQALLASMAAQTVGAHNHVIADVENLEAALAPYYTDPSGNVWRVQRTQLNVNFGNLIVGDHVSGFIDDTTNKSHWVEGIVLDNTIVLPGDHTNTAKFFKTNEQVKLT
jgi:hypothetical protein